MSRASDITERCRLIERSRLTCQSRKARPIAGKKPEARARKPGRPADPAKHAAIVDAASARFLECGYAATSIEQIAADAGVSKVTIYNKFGDKSGLFSAGIERECEKMRAFFEIGQMPAGTIRERLEAAAETICAFLSRPEMVQFERRIAAETEHQPALGEAFLKAGPWRVKRAVADWLDHACERGELEIADADLAAEQFVALAKGMGDLERRFGAHPDAGATRRRIHGALDVFLAAYAPR